MADEMDYTPDELAEICEDIRRSEDLGPIEKLCAWPYSDDDNVIHRSPLCTITIGDLRLMLSRADAS